MRKLLALVVLLGVAGVGRAGDKEIVERLKEAGVFMIDTTDGDRVVYLDRKCTDATLTELCELRRLWGVQLTHPGVTDAQLRQICALPALKSLSFSKCPTSDARLKIVVQARRLQWLYLDNSDVTDAGLPELTALRHLEGLSLDVTDVSDAGLRHLEGMSSLRSLHLRQCPYVTDEGVARLKRALPNCLIAH
jgi:hypothetical protein